MNQILLLLTVFLSSLTFGQKGTTLSKYQSFCKPVGSFNLEWNKFYPSTSHYNNANVENFDAYGVNVNLFKMYFGNFSLHHQIGFTSGKKVYNKLITDIDFEGGYKGSYYAHSSRFSMYYTAGFGYQFGNVLEWSVYAGGTARKTKYNGFYALDPGQEIKEEHAVTENEASSANSTLIDKKWNVGIKTGVEFAFIPNSMVSPFFRMNHQYFGARDVYSVPDARLNFSNGEVEIPTTAVSNTSDWGFVVGVRFNVFKDCPDKVWSKDDGGSSNRSSNRTRTSNTSTKKNNKGVVLTPKTTGRK